MLKQIIRTGKEQLQFNRKDYAPFLDILDSYVMVYKLEEKPVRYVVEHAYGSTYRVSVDFLLGRSQSPSTSFRVLLSGNEDDQIFKISVWDVWRFDGRKMRSKLIENGFKKYTKTYKKNDYHHYNIKFREPEDIMKLIDIFKNQLPYK